MYVFQEDEILIRRERVLGLASKLLASDLALNMHLAAYALPPLGFFPRKKVLLLGARCGGIDRAFVCVHCYCTVRWDEYCCSLGCSTQEGPYTLLLWN